MKRDNDLSNSLEKNHSTELGILRIKRNLGLETENAHSSVNIIFYIPAWKKQILENENGK